MGSLKSFSSLKKNFVPTKHSSMQPQKQKKEKRKTNKYKKNPLKSQWVWRAKDNHINKPSYVLLCHNETTCWPWHIKKKKCISWVELGIFYERVFEAFHKIYKHPKFPLIQKGHSFFLSYGSKTHLSLLGFLYSPIQNKAKPWQCWTLIDPGYWRV